VRRLARSCKQKRRISNNSRPRASSDRSPSSTRREVLQDLPPALYSPKCLEEEFSELPLYRVLGSSPQGLLGGIMLIGGKCRAPIGK
jgi:hypothetical protein